jgi:hypothetical protein
MNQEAYIISSTHSVVVLYTYWNYEGMLLMIPVFKTGQVSIKIKERVSHHPATYDLRLL